MKRIVVEVSEELHRKLRTMYGHGEVGVVLREHLSNLAGEGVESEKKIVSQGDVDAGTLRNPYSDNTTAEPARRVKTKKEKKFKSIVDGGDEPWPCELNGQHKAKRCIHFKGEK